MSEKTTGLRLAGIHECRRERGMTERGTTWRLENPRTLEFLEFINPSSWVEVAPLGATFTLVKPGFATMEFAVDITGDDPRQYGDGRGRSDSNL